ncbi:hypothetical protein EDB84DRAFT_1440456 [Lactarius hengduanensis]|nr:hypothetical protein EDB84DRAFT_1440456 [Lactarius hengduanensis]
MDVGMGVGVGRMAMGNMGMGVGGMGTGNMGVGVGKMDGMGNMGIGEWEHGALDTYWFCRCGGQVGWGTEHGNMGAGVGGIGIENMGVDVGGMENGNIRAWAWVSDGECEYEGNMGLEMGNVEVGVGVGEMGKEIVCIGVGVRGMEKGDMSIGVQEMGKGNLHMDLEVLLTSIFWQATGTNVHFIWLQSTESEYQSRTHNRANMEQKKWSM